MIEQFGVKDSNRDQTYMTLVALYVLYEVFG